MPMSTLGFLSTTMTGVGMYQPNSTKLVTTSTSPMPGKTATNMVIRPVSWAIATVWMT